MFEFKLVKSNISQDTSLSVHHHHAGRHEEGSSASAGDESHEEGHEEASTREGLFFARLSNNSTTVIGPVLELLFCLAGRDRARGPNPQSETTTPP